MSELKRCPFCGGEARLQRRAKKHGYYVVCKSCGCRTPYFQYQFDSNEELREEAIETWNTRKPMERIVGELEEAMERQWSYYNNAKSTGNIRQMDYSDGYAEGLTTAIEIVKEEGGVE